MLPEFFYTSVRCLKQKTPNGLASPPPKKRKEPLHCCPFCDREFKSEPEVDSHSLKEHQQSLFTCQDCPEDKPPFKAVEWSSMDSHLETKHGKVVDQIKSAVMPEDFRALKCKECSRKWYSQVCPFAGKKSSSLWN